MRKLNAYVHIKAPVETVRDLAQCGRHEWMITRGRPWLKTLAESWEATAAEDGTRFTFRVEYGSPLPFMETFMAERFHDSVTCSLGRLKQLAENSKLRH
ncbi:MAG TPA: SRPBCC family protein [Symbiobacteriaceae bacterium]|nr:SRPBCC family protein [Symbiobacteriaceae bacterium]